MPAKAWIGWGLTIAGVLAAAPLVLGRGNPSLAAARETVSNMSEVDREMLQRKYEQYRALSEQQRAELRQLHQQLELDRTKGPRFLETMKLYCDWVQTIDAWQQDELIHIDQPQARAAHVAKIVQERIADSDDPENEHAQGGGIFQPARLSEAQLTRVFDALTRRVTLTEEEQKQVDVKHGLRRFGTQLRFLQQKENPNAEKILRTLTESDLIELAQESGNADLKTLLASSANLDVKRRRVIRGILGSFVAQMAREATDVTDAQLQAHLATLPQEQQDQLLQLQADQFRNKLARSYLMSDPDVAELRNLIEREFNLINKRLRTGQTNNGPGGDGKGFFREPDGMKTPRAFANGQVGKNRRQPPDGRGPGGPPEDGPGPEFRPRDEPPPPRP